MQKGARCKVDLSLSAVALQLALVQFKQEFKHPFFAQIDRRLRSEGGARAV
jgi:hypothetical protein